MPREMESALIGQTLRSVVLHLDFPANLGRIFGYQEYMVCPWESAARVPDELSSAEAAPLLCAGITTYNGLCILATAPNGKAIEGIINGLHGRGKLMLIAAAPDPISINAFAMLSGRMIHGWPSGSSYSMSSVGTRSSCHDGLFPRACLNPCQWYRRSLTEMEASPRG